jgi:hypothetical protein
MDAMYFPAVAAFWGSASGGALTLVIRWATQRRKDHNRRAARASLALQELH